MVLSDQLLRLGTDWVGMHERTKIILRQPDISAQPVPVTRQTQRRLSPAEQVEIVRRYQAGARMKVLASEYGTHRHTISLCLRRLGIPLRHQGLQGDDIAEAARLYEAGWSLAGLSERYGCDHTTVWNAFRKHGVPLRPRPGWRY